MLLGEISRWVNIGWNAIACALSVRGQFKSERSLLFVFRHELPDPVGIGLNDCDLARFLIMPLCPLIHRALEFS